MAVIVSVLPWIDFVGFNPLDWPVWLLVVFGVLLAFNLGLNLISDHAYRDVNMYYKTASSNQPEGTLDNNVQKARPLEALVLSAGVLDEALIGLSIEPLVFGFLSNEVKQRLMPSFNPFPFLREGRSGESFFGPRQTASAIFHYFFDPVSAFLLWATGRLIEPRVTELILDTACAAGFGLPIREFSQAMVTPSNKLKVPGVFNSGEVVDVTKLFAKTRLTPQSPETLIPLIPLDFLWDDAKLEKKLENSFIWKRVQDKLDDIKTRAGRSDNDFELEVKRRCAIIEVRALEMFGMVELYHSQYYLDDQIIQAIALFLNDGTRPNADTFNSNETPGVPIL